MKYCLNRQWTTNCPEFRSLRVRSPPRDIASRVVKDVMSLWSNAGNSMWIVESHLLICYSCVSSHNNSRVMFSATMAPTRNVTIPTCLKRGAAADCCSVERKSSYISVTYSKCTQSAASSFQQL